MHIVKQATHRMGLAASRGGGVGVDPGGLREVLRIVSHKWDLVILTHLHERPLRYTELKLRIQVVASDLSEGVLSKDLKRLKLGGLIDRRSLDDRHHAWALTPQGREMVTGLAQVARLQAKANGQGPQPAGGYPDRDANADPPQTQPEYGGDPPNGVPPE